MTVPAPRPESLTVREHARMLRAGRCRVLGLHGLVDLVLADLRGHDEQVMYADTFHATVWVSCPPESLLERTAALIFAATRELPGVVVTFEIRRASRWHRLLGWLRVRRGQ